MTRSTQPDPLSPFDDPEREFRSRRSPFSAPPNSPVYNPFPDPDFEVYHNTLFTTAEYGYYSECEDKPPSRTPTEYPSDSEEEIEMAQDIENMTIEDYTSQMRDDVGPGVVRPAIERGVEFELKGQFLKELRENPFRGEEDEDANEHVEKILEIADMFNIPNVTRDQVMLRVFPITLKAGAKRWIGNEPAGSITTWEDLRTKFLKMYCPPSKTSKLIDEIRNFKQDIDESLYQAWERFKELLHKCPQHDLNSQQKIKVFYKGVDQATRYQLDSQGPIPKKTPGDAHNAIQDMAKHSQLWDDGSVGRRRSSKDSDGLAAITAKLDSMGRDIKKVNEKVHAIQVGCEICDGSHLSKDCPHKDSGINRADVMYGDFQGNPNFRQGNNNYRKPYYQNNQGNSGQFQQGPPGFYTRDPPKPPFPEKKINLEEMMSQFLTTNEKFMASSSKRMEDSETALRNQGASIKQIEGTVHQIAKVLQERFPGTLPGFTETNPRENVKAIITRSGKSLNPPFVTNNVVNDSEQVKNDAEVEEGDLKR